MIINDVVLASILAKRSWVIISIENINKNIRIVFIPCDWIVVYIEIAPPRKDQENDTFLVIKFFAAGKINIFCSNFILLVFIH